MSAINRVRFKPRIERGLRCSYRIYDHSAMRRIVWIVDEDLPGKMSITNDAEMVVTEVIAKYPNHRIVYRDSEGRWDELKHLNGEFTTFGFIRQDDPDLMP